MKTKFVSLIASAFAFAAFTAHAETTLSVAATAVPHAEILEHVKPVLAKEGITLKVKVFTDYVQPNVQVAEKKIDVNFFQHKPYLDEFNKNKGTNLVSVAPVHVEPYGAYSKKVKKVADLPNGALIAIPNDPSNGGRALLLLEQNGLIKLKDSKNILSTVKDIAEALRAEGHVVDRYAIALENPIKQLGIFEIGVRLHPEVTATVKLWVVKK